MPVPTASFFGIDIGAENNPNAQVEYRSACVFAKRIIEKRRRVKSCFADVISPSPPPPPPADNVKSAQAAMEQEENRRINGESGQYATGYTNEMQFYIDEVQGSIAETNSLLNQIGGSNPVLKSLLFNAIDEMTNSVNRVSTGEIDASSYYGRRLMQRRFDYASSMGDVLVDHPIQQAAGKEGIPGVNRATCEALCAGVTTTTNASNPENCQAFAFKRAAPFSITDDSGRCYLLRVCCWHQPQYAKSQTLTQHWIGCVLAECRRVHCF